MPIVAGFHPFYQVTDAPRDEWTIRIPARDHMTLSPQLLPTGEKTPVTTADTQILKGVQFDDVFANLKRESDGLSEFFVKGKNQKVTVRYGPGFNTGVVYAPPGRAFVC